MLHCRRKRYGNFSGSLIISLLLTLILMPICLSSVDKCINLPFDYYMSEDEISIRQLQRILAISYQIENHGRQIYFIYKGNRHSLEKVNNHLVLKPGSQIFFENIDDAFFQNEDGLLIITLKRNKEENKVVLCQEESFSINNLSMSFS